MIGRIRLQFEQVGSTLKNDSAGYGMAGFNVRAFVMPSLALWGLLLAAFVGTSVQAVGRPDDQKTNANPILVELFTSEGCSSCPPADEFVQRLDTLQPVAGAHLIVLSEHVDYWDHDGWKDPNSSHSLTERQGNYVRMLGLNTPYTPQIIVDGSREVKIGDPQGAEKVFLQAATSPKVPIHITDVNLDTGNPDLLRAHVDAEPTALKHGADVYVAIALDHVESQVLRGENGGRHLTHVAVVQQIAKIGKLNKTGGFTEDVQLKIKAGIPINNLRVVAFAQESGPGKLVGASLWKLER
jgi:hypothetical protein